MGERQEEEREMATIQGVHGPIDPDDLGFTLMHEHILIANWSMRQAFADWVDTDEVIEFATGELRKAKDVGGRTVVDRRRSSSG